MRPILLIVWTEFRSFILQDNNNSEEECLRAVRREGVENQETAASFKDRRRTEKYPRMERDAIIWAVCETVKIKETMKHGLG